MVVKDLVTVVAAGETVTFPDTGGGGSRTVGYFFENRYFESDAAIRFTNLGTIQYYDQAYAISVGLSAPRTFELNNQGVIEATATSGVTVQGVAVGRFNNTGELRVEGQKAYVAMPGKSFVTNSGLISAKNGSFGSGSSSALEVSGGSVINSGVIQVQAEIWGIGVFFNSGSGLDPIYVLNTGSITARDAGATYERAVGIHVSGNAATVINEGRIDADIALQVYELNNRTVRFENSGEVIGRIEMGVAADTVINGGTIKGVIDLGLGNDRFEAKGMAAQGMVSGGAGNDTILGAGGSDTLRGGEGNDFIDGGDQFDDTHGNQGSDTIYGRGGDDWVVGGQDGDMLYGDSGDDLVFGNMGDDSCYGGVGADTIRGGQHNDLIFGDAGDDLIFGDRGDDTIGGGLGADTFVTFAGAGIDRILDFSLAQGDKIRIEGGGAYSVTQKGADTVIALGSGDAQMVLVGVQASSLPPGTIVLA